MPDPSTVRVVRRHGLLALIIAGTCVVLMGVFVLLWIKLPVWAPEWVVEHSPFADPIVRAVVDGDASEDRAAERLGKMGASQVPRLLSLIDHPDYELRSLAAKCLERIRDARVVQPMFDQLLKEVKDQRMWIYPLSRQDPTAVADLLLRQLVTGKIANIYVVQLAGMVADDRVVTPLQAILEQPWEKEDPDDYSRLRSQPTTVAAMALMDSTCTAAVPALLHSLASPDPVIRFRVLVGVSMNANRNRNNESDPAYARRWDEPLQNLLFRALTDADPLVREQAAILMSVRRIEGAEPILIEMSRSSDFRLRRAAIRGLDAQWYGPAAHRRIVECLRDPESKVQLFAVFACGQIDDPPPTTELIEVLSSSNERVRGAACLLLQRKVHVSDPRIFPAMLHLMDDPSQTVRKRAELGAYSAASTPVQKQAAIDASRRLKEGAEKSKPPAGSPSVK